MRHSAQLTYSVNPPEWAMLSQQEGAACIFLSGRNVTHSTASAPSCMCSGVGVVMNEAGPSLDRVAKYHATNSKHLVQMFLLTVIHINLNPKLYTLICGKLCAV